MLNIQFRQTRIFFTVAATLAISIGFLTLVIFPLANHTRDLSAEILKNRASLENITREIEEHQRLSQDLARVEEGRQKIAAMFPSREEILPLVEGLEAAARASGASKYELELSDAVEDQTGSAAQGDGGAALPAGASRIEAVPFRATVAGDYRVFANYLTFLENLPFVVDVGKLSITAESAQGNEQGSLVNTGQGAAELSGVLYIKKP